MARSGPYQGVIFSGLDPATGSVFVDYENFAGGTGARAAADGASSMQVHITNTSNLPIEAFETEFPMTVERFELIPDSGGAGRFRGGLGVRREFRIETGGVHVSVRSARQRIRAGGLAGGGPGAPGAFSVLAPGGGERRIASTATDVPLAGGEVMTVRTPGGGGVGDPRTRDAARVLEDVRDGYVSAEAAAREYGVVLKDEAIDAEATRRRRSDRPRCSAGQAASGEAEA
jgi:N-methylhydantoinase B